MIDITVNDLEILKKHIENINPSIIVVEGYDGVGKSRVIEYLQETYEIHAYRPDYLGWFHEVPRDSRWISMVAFLDIIKNQKITLDHKLLFDRGFLSGPVYNQDMKLALAYKDVVKGMKILHILVTCSKHSYERFNSNRSSNKYLDYDECLRYTERYKVALELTDLEYIEFQNNYDEEFSRISERTCRGCGHYNVSDGYCKHPRINKFVPKDQLRCEYASDLEVQDIG